MKSFSILTILSFCLLLNAQRPGDLNTDFGLNGFFIDNWTDTSTMVYDMRVMPDSNLVLSGNYTCDPTDNISYILKLNNEGNLVNFGNFPHGFRNNFGSYFETSSTVTVLPDNNILAAGQYWADNEGLSLNTDAIMLNSEGIPDEVFATHGIFDSPSAYMNIEDVDVYKIEDSYNIILAGYSAGMVPKMLMLVRNGSIVTGFGTDGFVTAEGYNGKFIDIAVDSKNNCLYVCGQRNDLSGTVVAKYNLPEGELDTDFGTNGYILSGALHVAAYAMVLDTVNNTLTLFGNYLHEAGDKDIFACRISTAYGLADETFGILGWSWLRAAGSDEYITSALLQTDGKYYFGGYSDYNGSSDDFFIARICSNGIADTTFGFYGLQLTAAPDNQYIQAIALSPAEDMLYAAGYSKNSENNTSLVVAAYYTRKKTVPQPIVGIESNSNEIVRIFPNPSKGPFTIETELSGLHSLQIFDLAGREMFYEKFKGTETELNLETLKPAVYILRITFADEQVRIYKLIRQ